MEPQPARGGERVCQTLEDVMDPLRSLGLNALNSGAGFGPDAWAATDADNVISSFNPTTGEAIASVTPATASDCEKIVDISEQAFLRWRMVPAPKRGEMVRRFG